MAEQPWCTDSLMVELGSPRHQSRHRWQRSIAGESRRLGLRSGPARQTPLAASARPSARPQPTMATAACSLTQQRACAALGRRSGAPRPAAAAARRPQQPRRLQPPRAVELFSLAELDIDWSDPDTQIGALGAVLGLALGIGVPAFYARCACKAASDGTAVAAAA